MIVYIYNYSYYSYMIFLTADSTRVRSYGGITTKSILGQIDLCWTLTRPVTVGFCRDLHRYLRQEPSARSATKTTVGTLYSLVDVNFKSTNRPGNIYMFV